MTCDIDPSFVEASLLSTNLFTKIEPSRIMKADEKIK
jgi:hypothetical protein